MPGGDGCPGHGLCPVPAPFLERPRFLGGGDGGDPCSNQRRVREGLYEGRRSPRGRTRIERKVQKGRASATDTFVSSFGGVVLIRGTEKKRLPPVNLPLVVGNSRVSHNTSLMVEKVGRERERLPGIVNPILDAIGAVTQEALLQLHDPRALGTLMNTNHALLEALGVGHPALTRLVLAARAAGAFGAKITGAGGGGCMIALAPSRAKGSVAGAIRSCDAQAIMTTLDTEGARKEKNG